MANNIRQDNSNSQENHTIPNRLLFAFAVAVGILYAIDYVEKKYAPEQNVAQAQEIQVDPLNPSKEKVFGAKTSIVQTTEVERNIDLDTKRYNFKLDLTGAKITELELKDYVQEKGKDELVSIFYKKGGKDGENAVSFDAGWLADNIATPNRTTNWTLVGKTKDSVMLSYDNDQGIKFFRTYTFDNDKFLVNVQDKVVNASGNDVKLVHYSQIHHKGEREERLANSFTNYTGPEAIIDNEHIKADYEDLQDGEKFYKEGKNVWAGVTTQYFASVMIPDNSKQSIVDFKYNKLGDDNYYTTLVKGPVEYLKPNSEIVNDYKIYAGPKSVGILSQQGVDESIKLNAMIDYGWFHPIAKLIHQAVVMINGYVGSLAITIILVTILLKMILFPLANKSYHSMAEMKKIQPEIKRLQDKYGHDRQALGLEMMNLYKKHKVSPASGCWPMLIQIPIFFSMYKVVLMSFEFRQADLGLWIHDMSAADPYFVLPILMGATMLIQQKLNPAPADETQKMVMNAMPIAFTVMFLFFPAGLVLYWLTNNVLSIIQQAVIMKKHNAKLN